MLGIFFYIVGVIDVVSFRLGFEVVYEVFGGSKFVRVLEIIKGFCKKEEKKSKEGGILFGMFGVGFGRLLRDG